MKRRTFLASSSAALTIAVAGCSSTDDDGEATPRDENNSTQTNETDTTDSTESDINKDEFVHEMPESMDDIAAFGFNTHQERIRMFSFELDVLTRTEPKDGSAIDEQDIEYTYKLNDDSMFILQTEGAVNGDVQRYSVDKYQYSRLNPTDDDIQYRKDPVENDVGVFFYDGFNLIDQLHKQSLTVGDPQQVNEHVVRYPITGHRAYTDASGHIDINLKDGLFSALEFTGENSDEVYTMRLEYNYEDVPDIEKPAWVKDID